MFFFQNQDILFEATERGANFIVVAQFVACSTKSGGLYNLDKPHVRNISFIIKFILHDKRLQPTGYFRQVYFI